MSPVIEEEIKRRTALRRSAPVLETIQGKITIEGKAGIANVLKAKPEDVRGQDERQLKALQGACGEAMLGML